MYRIPSPLAPYAETESRKRDETGGRKPKAGNRKPKAEHLKPKAENQKRKQSENGGRKPKAGNRKPKAETESRKPKTESRKRDESESERVSADRNSYKGLHSSIHNDCRGPPCTLHLEDHPIGVIPLPNGRTPSLINGGPILTTYIHRDDPPSRGPFFSSSFDCPNPRPSCSM